MNLPKGSDWREFCATTPISLKHMDFPGAEECFTSVCILLGRELDQIIPCTDRSGGFMVDGKSTIVDAGRDCSSS